MSCLGCLAVCELTALAAAVSLATRAPGTPVSRCPAAYVLQAGGFSAKPLAPGCGLGLLQRKQGVGRAPGSCWSGVAGALGNPFCLHLRRLLSLGNCCWRQRRRGRRGRLDPGSEPLGLSAGVPFSCQLGAGRVDRAPEAEPGHGQRRAASPRPLCQAPGVRRQIWGSPGILIHQGSRQVPSLQCQGR